MATWQKPVPKPHPGPFRFMRVDAGIAGVGIAAGFVLMGLVGLPIAKWFLLAAVALALVVALILHFTRKQDLVMPHFTLKK